MTSLCEMIMECQAIKGMDRLVLYGWAAQIEEGNDTLFCSKEAVAESIGVSDDTVLRRTQALVKAGWIIETGKQKQWKFGWTPVRIINVPVIVGLVEAQCRKLRPPAECTPPQNAAQGSTGSLVLGLDLLCSTSSSPCSASATGVPPAPLLLNSKTVEQPEGTNRKPENRNHKTNTDTNIPPMPKVRVSLVKIQRALMPNGRPYGQAHGRPYG
jgi:hypothetical protein